MFSLLDLRLVLCSIDLDVLRVQRIMDFLSLLPTNQRGRKIRINNFKNIWRRSEEEWIVSQNALRIIRYYHYGVTSSVFASRRGGSFSWRPSRQLLTVWLQFYVILLWLITPLFQWIIFLYLWLVFYSGLQLSRQKQSLTVKANSLKAKVTHRSTSF